jgi:hypothetical protein
MRHPCSSAARRCAPPIWQFALDVFTCIPFDIVFSAIVTATGLQVDPQSFRLLRMLRLAKLLRMLRASRIVNRWQVDSLCPYLMDPCVYLLARPIR